MAGESLNTSPGSSHRVQRTGYETGGEASALLVPPGLANDAAVGGFTKGESQLDPSFLFQ